MTLPNRNCSIFDILDCGEEEKTQRNHQIVLGQSINPYIFHQKHSIRQTSDVYSSMQNSRNYQNSNCLEKNHLLTKKTSLKQKYHSRKYSIAEEIVIKKNQVYESLIQEKKKTIQSNIVVMKKQTENHKKNIFFQYPKTLMIRETNDFLVKSEKQHQNTLQLSKYKQKTQIEKTNNDMIITFNEVEKSSSRRKEKKKTVRFHDQQNKRRKQSLLFEKENFRSKLGEGIYTEKTLFNESQSSQRSYVI